MTLFSTAVKNMKGNFRNYLIYFVSMMFSVVIYHTFVSLQYSADIQASIALSKNIDMTFKAASAILILFVAIFIWYSNSFFTRKRKKEVALYALLGVRKRSIGKMLFYENLVISIIVLAAGIFVGTLLSKMFAMLLLKLLGSTAEIGFSISGSAILNTTLVFAVIILITSIQGYRLIYRFKLIELFQAEKQAETVPKASPVLAILAVVLLAAGYGFISLSFKSESEILRNYSVAFVGITLGTYLLFRCLTVFLLRLAQKNKARYYRGLNVVGTSQLLFRMRGNVGTLTIIALLSAFTLLATNIAFSQYYTNTKHADQSSPFSYMHLSQGQTFDEQVKQIIGGDKEHPVTAELDIPVIKSSGHTSSSEVLPARYSEEDEQPVKIISVSTYKAIAKALNRNITVNPMIDEAVAVKTMYTDYSLSDYEKEKLKLETARHNVELSFTQLLEDRFLNWTFPDFVIVVNDERYNDLEKLHDPILYKAYKVKDESSAAEASNKLMRLAGAEQAGLSSYYNVYKMGLEDTGIGTFAAVFLGLVFLAATGSVLYFKQLTEAHSDKERYAILRKIGVTRKEIRVTILKQTLFIFGLPLILGITHSIVVVNAMSKLFSNMVDVNFTVPVLFSTGLYIIIYLFYYFLTVNSFNKIVNS
ncbi:ABC transporter permease [Paenibacillus sp. LHD-38]|uniref:ABC transporter permease n=1 Tax=Paenibacillus sp. LHD-38 TaxID=3072143 RepID=UPI00280FCE95|nr:ABC transporter permease [Paenibacillus sp. LHD-38]MDQ8733238.1 ABC transporter permease [Paenibacillus sp. LHD-38]